VLLREQDISHERASYLSPPGALGGKDELALA